jgi:pSer/pThr/pTyr-binding forkhead associated (FHA) protein
MASLIIITGKQKGDFYPLGRRTNVIGRDEALLIQILDNMISRKHMQIRFDEKVNKYYALDMKSSNGA